MTFASNVQEFRERREAEKAANLRALAIPTRSLRPGSYAGILGAAVAKDAPLRSEAYRRLVAAMPCWYCGIEGHSQAAHADQGKGLGIKSDDRTCYPACGPHDGVEGCHHLIGTSGTYSREERRALEERAGIETRAAIKAAGVWPKNLPDFNEKESKQ